jgi:hypothetical protein
MHQISQKNRAIIQFMAQQRVNRRGLDVDDLLASLSATQVANLASEPGEAELDSLRYRMKYLLEINLLQEMNTKAGMRVVVNPELRRKLKVP